MLRGLAALRSWSRLIVCDADPEAAARLARRHQDVPTELAATPGEAAREAGIVILATWSREPLLDSGDVRPGTHVTSLGADEPGKAELSPGLLTAARVFVDDVPLALTSGALGTAGLPAEAVAGTLSEVLRGTVPGRRDDTERTVYTPVGLPGQDLALAWAAYREARRTGRGREYDFLA